MSKKEILYVILALSVGTIIGGFGAILYFGSAVQDSVKVSQSLFLSDWSRRAFNAYRYEKPETAIWALENLTQILEKQITTTEQDIKRMDLALAYTRLALIWDKTGNKPKYSQSISKGLRLMNEIHPKETITEEELLNYVQKMDNVAKKNK